VSPFGHSICIGKEGEEKKKGGKSQTGRAGYLTLAKIPPPYLTRKKFRGKKEKKRGEDINLSKSIFLHPYLGKTVLV